MEKIKNFSDLYAWKEGNKLVQMVYRITAGFPKEELYGIVSQMRRSAVSVTSNVAEGFARPTAADKNRFYWMALGSIAELQSQLMHSRDLSFCSAVSFQEAFDQTIQVRRLLNGLLKSSFHPV